MHSYSTMYSVIKKPQYREGQGSDMGRRKKQYYKCIYIFFIHIRVSGVTTTRLDHVTGASRARYL
jgi:hypothetical protein